VVGAQRAVSEIASATLVERLRLGVAPFARGAKNIERLRSPRPIFPTISDRKTAKPNESGFVLIER
jgi:hypothetical protein